MKKILLLFLFLSVFYQVESQCVDGTLIEIADFEGAYTGLGGWATDYVSSVGDCESTEDLFGLTTGVGGISPQSGSQFWGTQDVTGDCGTNTGETLTFTYTVPGSATYTDVEVCFWYTVEGFDSGDDIFTTISTTSGGEVCNKQIVDGMNGGGVDVEWTQGCFIVSVVPNDVVTLTITIDQNGDDFGGIDNVSICETTGSPSCLFDLPVDLILFNAVESNNTTNLSWTTASELNNSHFNIEHSIDGTNFRTIGEVIGNGTTQLKQEYSYTHATPMNGANYYRLKQVDFDGAFEYSHIEVVEIERAGKVIINPSAAIAEITVQLAELSNENNEIGIYDMMGRTVLMSNFDVTLDTKTIDISNLQKGYYVVRIQSGNEVFTERFMKMVD